MARESWPVISTLRGHGHFHWPRTLPIGNLLLKTKLLQWAPRQWPFAPCSVSHLRAEPRIWGISGKQHYITMYCQGNVMTRSSKQIHKYNTNEAWSRVSTRSRRICATGQWRASTIQKPDLREYSYVTLTTSSAQASRDLWKRSLWSSDEKSLVDNLSSSFNQIKLRHYLHFT